MAAVDSREEAEAGLPDLQPGDVVAGKYRVDRVVGTGGMGLVVAATHLQLGQQVAIKVLAVDESRRTEATARFLREGRAAAALTSDHVVRIHDVGTLESGAAFMVMELLRGGDLADYLARHGTLSVSEAVCYVLQACDAIGEAHAHGVVHRDLKPANLFLTRRSDGSPLEKVLDFGISKSLHKSGRETYDGTLTASRAVMGSPAYMSPEQVRDASSVDHRSDVWSLGVILYELLAGRPAFEADTLPAVCAAIVADAPLPITLVRDDVPIGLQAVIERCMEKDPRRRFQSATELALALKPFAAPAAEGVVRAEVGADGYERVVDGPPATIVEPEQQSIERQDVARRAQLESAPTVTGGGPDGTLISGYRMATSPGRASGWGRRPVVIAGAVAVVLTAAGAFWLVRSAPVAEKLAASTPAPAPPSIPSAFTLSIESTPTGAEVYEQDVRRGTTPLRIAIDKSAARARPHRYVIRHPGYRPYALSQGHSDSDVRVLATLVPEPSATPTSTPSASAPTGGREPVPTLRRRSAPPPPVTAEAGPVAPPPAPDIRMQR
jgi:serine/threonine protein kinase